MPKNEFFCNFLENASELLAETSYLDSFHTATATADTTATATATATVTATANATAIAMSIATNIAELAGRVKTESKTHSLLSCKTTAGVARGGKGPVRPWALLNLPRVGRLR